MRASHVDLEVTNTIDALPQRYYPTMLSLLLSLRTFPQARYDALVQSIALQASRRQLSEADVEELRPLLVDRRVSDATLDWFLAQEIVYVDDLRRRVELPPRESDLPRA